MIGVFDSGSGGERTARIIRSAAPLADLALLTDRENSPFGRRTEDELIGITEAGINRLRDAGCERVLIACCTASTVHPMLKSEAREISLPIIMPTAKAAAELSESGRIAVIATEATVRSHAFSDILEDVCASEIEASELVDLIESGNTDTSAARVYLGALAQRIADSGADVLILGCTHFGLVKDRLEAEVKKIIKRKIKTVDSAETGAREILKLARTDGSGATVRIETKKERN